MSTDIAIDLPIYFLVRETIGVTVLLKQHDPTHSYLIPKEEMFSRDRVRIP